MDLETLLVIWGILAVVLLALIILIMRRRSRAQRQLSSFA